MNFIEREHTVLEENKMQMLKCNTPRLIVARLLDYKENEEIMRRRY